jgi:hypothetical protein
MVLTRAKAMIPRTPVPTIMVERFSKINVI